LNSNGTLTGLLENDQKLLSELYTSIFNYATQDNRTEESMPDVSINYYHSINTHL
jgi:hypothetical protein